MYIDHVNCHLIYWMWIFTLWWSSLTLVCLPLICDKFVWEQKMSEKVNLILYCITDVWIKFNAVVVVDTAYYLHTDVAVLMRIKAEVFF